MKAFFKSFLILCLFGIAVTSAIQSAYADGTVTVTDPTDDLVILGGQAPAPKPFYVSFADIVEASVTLQSGSLVFEETVLSVPSNWLTPSWNPTFSNLPSQQPVDHVVYEWHIFHNGRVGDVAVRWTPSGVTVSLIQCVGGNPGEGPCVEIVRTTLPDSALNWNPVTGSLSVTVLKAQFDSLFPDATGWRATAFAYLNDQFAVNDRAPSPPCEPTCGFSIASLPT